MTEYTTRVDHTAKAFDTDLQEITRKVAEMGGLAERQIADATQALVERDTELAERVISGDAAVDEASADIYRKLTAAGVDVLYDDRNERAGGKFADMDLIGLPWQLVVGPRGLANGVIELKRRATGERTELPIADAVAQLTASAHAARQA